MKAAFHAILLFLVSAAALQAASFASGENQDGTITAGSSDTWTITAAVNDTLIFRVGELTGGGAFTPEISLTGPNGAALGTNWGAVDADLTHRAVLAGTYTVVVRGRNASDAGTYRLRVLKIPGGFVVPGGDEGGALANGQNHDGTVSVGDLDAWTVTAAVNDSLIFRIAELTGGAAFTPRITLYGPDGASHGSNWGGLDADLNHRATLAGTYTVVVQGYNYGDAGTYRLRSLRVPGAFVVPGGDDGGALTNGQNHDGTIDVADLDAWTVTAAVNDTMVFRIGELSGGSGFTPRITLYGPNGASLGSNWGGVDADLNHRATLAGTYTLVVQGYNYGDTGTYRLRSLKIPETFVVPNGDDGGPLTNGQNHDGTVDVGDLDAWTVTAAVNDSLVFRIGELSGGSAFTPRITLYGPDGASLGSNWGGVDADLNHRATLAGTYTLVVQGYNYGDAGSYRLRLVKAPGAFTVPSGDEGGALANGIGAAGTILVGDLDAWTVTAAVSDALSFRITKLSGGSGFTPRITLFGPDGTPRGSNWGAAEVDLAHNATVSGVFTVVIQGYNYGDAGTYQLSVAGASGALAPAIAVHPVSQTISQGGSASLVVTATGTAPLSYQWRRDNVEIAGATTSSYAINNAQAASAGSYTVIVSNAVGSVTSNAAVISIGSPPALPVIVTQPVAQTVAPGSTATFTVVAQSAAPLTYLWRKDGTPLPGATSALLVLPNVTAGDVGAYSVVVSNAAGGTTSNAATLTVSSATVAPTILTQPIAQTVNAGTGAGFSVVASGTAPLAYQWRKNGAAVAGATAATFSFASAQNSDAGTYSVVVTNAAGSVTSNDVSLVVIPVIASRISNVSVRTALGANQTLIVGMSMSGGSKPVLIRGVGPGLATFGVTGTMPDPRLSLFEGNTAIDTNDNWGGTPLLSAMFTAVGAFGLPAASLDAALTRSIEGGRTAQISGTAGGTVLVEAYDAGSGNSPRLVNISARNFAGTGDNILIAGFTIAGTAPKTVLIRAVGPTLAAFGVDGVLVDPKLEIYSGATKISENDTWAPGLAATFNSVGAFALVNGSKDAAIVVSLPPGGGYTVQVSGADGGTGEALVEIYEVTP